MLRGARTIILIHGYGFDFRIWSPVELAFEGHNVLYLNLPGFDNDLVSEYYSIDDLAKRFWFQLDQKKIAQVDLVGHSMGGYVCLEMLASQPSRVRSLALVHSHVFADSEEKRFSRNQAIDDIKNNGRAGFVSRFFPPLVSDPVKSLGVVENLMARGLQYNDDAWIYGTAAIRDRKDQSEVLRSYNSSVLLLMGEDDKAVPAKLAFQQASIAERTVFHMYPGVGHLGMYENTHQMIGDIINFYSGLSA